MQGDGQGRVTHMTPDEIRLFEVYQQQVEGPSGRDRDDLPYTEEFDQVRSQYTQATGNAISQREFWLLLKLVLKYGVRNITQYIQDLPPNS